MEINRSNFRESLPLVLNAIKESDFVAIDAEFTGLTWGKEPNSYDTLPTYYKKKVYASSEFLILQLGLAIFKFDQETNRFNSACFNFYLFPFPISGIIRNINFKCQSESISFLAAHGFDFNKVFHNGIPYLSRSEEDAYRRQLQDKRQKRIEQIGKQLDYCPIAKLQQEDAEDIIRISKRIMEFINTAQPGEELDLGKFNSFKRRLIYQNVGMKFHGKVVFDTRPSPLDANGALQNVVVFLRGTKEEQLQREDAKIQEEERNLEEAIGFSYVMRQISESGKLLVGHNMFLDILHITNAFMQKLPADYYSFKDLVSVTFPKIIDTKYMASSDPWQDKIKCSVLKDMVHDLPNPELGIMPGCQSYSVASDKCHEAAYDAFLTGVCFLSMLKDADPNFSNLADILVPYINRIFIYKLVDIPYLNMAGLDIQPTRDNVIYMSFPKDWKTENLILLFQKIGKVTVSWLDDSSAFIVFQNKGLAKKALERRQNLSKCLIVPFMTYESMINTGAPIPLTETQRSKLAKLPKMNDAATRLYQKSQESKSDDSDEFVAQGESFNFIRSSNATEESLSDSESDETDDSTKLRLVKRRKSRKLSKSSQSNRSSQEALNLKVTEPKPQTSNGKRKFVATSAPQTKELPYKKRKPAHCKSRKSGKSIPNKVKPAAPRVSAKIFTEYNNWDD